MAQAAAKLVSAISNDGRDRLMVAPPSLRPVLAAALTRRAQGARGFVLAVTATAREADDLVAGLGSFLPPSTVACFPGWETLPHERLSPRSDTVGQRIAVLRRLAHPADPGSAGNRGAVPQERQQPDRLGRTVHASDSAGSRQRDLYRDRRSRPLPAAKE